MAEGYHGGGSDNYPPLDQGRDDSLLDKAERKRLKRKFETYPRMRLMGLDWLIPRDDR